MFKNKILWDGSLCKVKRPQTTRREIKDKWFNLIVGNDSSIVANILVILDQNQGV